MDENNLFKNIISSALGNPLQRMTREEIDYLIDVSKEISRMKRKYDGTSYLSANLDVIRFALTGIIGQAYDPSMERE